MKRTVVDINCDIGEGAPHDAELMKLVTTANIACGKHAGDEGLMRRTVRLAIGHGVAVGAHPGFPDRANFGRKTPVIPMDELHKCVTSQVLALREIAREEGGTIASVKPHGALYNLAMDDNEIAMCVAEAAASLGKNIFIAGMPDSALGDLCRIRGIRFVREGFPERTYDNRGRLVPRSKTGAVISDPKEAALRGIEMATNGATTSAEGVKIPLGKIETLCIHGDSPGCVEMAKALRLGLENAGLKIEAVSGTFVKSRKGIRK